MTRAAASTATPTPGGGMVSIEFDGGVLTVEAAVIAAEDWNGFARPSFSAAAVEAIAASLRGQNGDALVTFDAAAQVVTVTEEGAPDEPYEVHADASGPEPVYAIGAGHWAWRIVEND